MSTRSSSCLGVSIGRLTGALLCFGQPRARSSAEEHPAYTRAVAGSTPAAPTSTSSIYRDL